MRSCQWKSRQLRVLWSSHKESRTERCEQCSFLESIRNGFVLIVGRAARTYSNVEALRTIRWQHGDIRGSEKFHTDWSSGWGLRTKSSERLQGGAIYLAINIRYVILWTFSGKILLHHFFNSLTRREWFCKPLSELLQSRDSKNYRRWMPSMSWIQLLFTWMT